MMLAGVGGTGLIPGRNLDRFGVGYFRYSFSEDLSDGLRLFGLKLGDEHGGELFYEGKAAVSAELAPVFKIDRREYLKSNYSAVSLAEAVRQLLPKAEVTAVSGAGVVPKEPTDNSGRSRCSAECQRRHPRRRRPIGMVQRAHRRRRL
jgi:beta-glucosidase